MAGRAELRTRQAILEDIWAAQPHDAGDGVDDLRAQREAESEVLGQASVVAAAGDDLAEDEIDAFVAPSDTDAGGVLRRPCGGRPRRAVADLAGTVIALTGSASELVHEPRPADDPRVRRPEIARAAELLGWRPTVGLADGLRRTIEWQASFAR